MILPLFTREARRLFGNPPGAGDSEMRSGSSERVEAGKNELASKIGKSDAGFVFLGKDVSNVMFAWNVEDGGGLEPNAVADSNLPDVHMTKAFRKRGAATPINRATIVVIQQCGMRDVRKVEVLHKIAHHFDRFSAFIHSVNFCLTWTAWGFRFAYATPGHRSTTAHDDVAQEGSNGFFSDVNNLIQRRVRGVLRPPIGIGEGDALRSGGWTSPPIWKVLSVNPALSEANVAVLGALEVTKYMFHSFKEMPSWRVVGKLWKKADTDTEVWPLGACSKPVKATNSTLIGFDNVHFW
jgi:hypothetical protein